MRTKSTIVGCATMRGLKSVPAAGRALLYIGPTRLLAHLVWLVGNYGFVFLALHLMSKTMASIAPAIAQKRS
jgi:hypothetical protein